MALRHEKGLYYNYDEKWSSTHHCKGHVLLFIADHTTSDPNPDFSTSLYLSPNPDPAPTLDPGSDIDTSPSIPHISLHALSDLPSPKTFRLFGVIHHARLTILIDSGSTHNFIQPRIAHFLHLPTQPTSPLHVLVGNGSILDYTQL